LELLQKVAGVRFFFETQCRWIPYHCVQNTSSAVSWCRESGGIKSLHVTRVTDE